MRPTKTDQNMCIMSTYMGKEKETKKTKFPKYGTITDALLLNIAGDLAPLSVLDSPYLRNMMKKAKPRYQVPSRKPLSSKLLNEKAEEIRNEVKDQLKRA